MTEEEQEIAAEDLTNRIGDHAESALAVGLELRGVLSALGVTVELMMEKFPKSERAYEWLTFSDFITNQILEGIDGTD